MKREMLVIACTVVLLCMAFAGENNFPKPPEGLPQPTREQVDKAIDHLKKKRDKASGEEREKIERTIEYLKAYKSSGMDARKMMAGGRDGKGTSKPAGSRGPSAGSPVRPPVKGGVVKPRGMELR